MKKNSQILFLAYLLAMSNCFAQNFNSAVSSAETTNNPEVEFEYEDGSIENKIENSSHKKKKKIKPTEVLVKISEEEKKAKGYHAPMKFFDLSDWSLSVPTDEDGNGKADHIKEVGLSMMGYKSDYFYANNDGGLVMTCPIGGFRTSSNTSYTRVELREMLRAGNTDISTKGTTKNNWVHKKSRASKKAGGYDGQLKATLAINKVTTTGNQEQIGRVIIGQIHAKDNEPIRLYYRKLPNNEKGSIYFAHEKRDGKEEYHELIGSKSKKAANPEKGIALNEKFSYTITLLKNELTVKIYRPYKPVVKKTVNIRTSGYKARHEYLYFKAGVYNQNKSGEPNDYVRATFYELSNSHNNGEVKL